MAPSLSALITSKILELDLGLSSASLACFGGIGGRDVIFLYMAIECFKRPG